MQVPGQRLHRRGALLSSPPAAEWLIADRGDTMPTGSKKRQKKVMRPCILGRKTHGRVVRYNRRRYRIEIMFGRLKDWPTGGKTVHRTVF